MEKLIIPGKSNDWYYSSYGAGFLYYSGDNYRCFIDAMMKYADCICLTYDCCNYGWYRYQSGYSADKIDEAIYEDFLRSDWSFLKDSIIDFECTNRTPVTMGSRVLLLYLRCDDTAAEWLKSRRHIYDFYGNDTGWAEDLCFARNGKIFFTSCSHEHFFSFYRKINKKVYAELLSLRNRLTQEDTEKYFRRWD